MLCAEEYRSIQACGREVQIRMFCTNQPLPAITPAMRQEALAYPELQDDYERENACLKDSGDCAARPEKNGGEELSEELQRYKDMDDPEQVEALRRTITDEPVKGFRDAAAIVAKRGFARTTADYHMIYRVFHDKQFHESAEGVYLVSKKIVDEELAEQRKLAGILREMRIKFEGTEDRRSLRSTSTYEGIAMGQADMLAAVSCELGRLAAVSGYRQRMMASAEDGIIPSGPVFEQTLHLGNGAHGRESEITGVVQAPLLLEKKPDDEAKIEGEAEKQKGELLSLELTPQGWNAETYPEPEKDPQLRALQALSGVGLARAVASIPRPRYVGPEEESLFTRVRRKHRHKYEAGVFVRKVWP